MSTPDVLDPDCYCDGSDDRPFRCPNHDVVAEMFAGIGRIGVRTISERADGVYESSEWKYADYELV